MADVLMIEAKSYKVPILVPDPTYSLYQPTRFSYSDCNDNSGQGC